MSTLGVDIGDTTLIALPLFRIGGLAGPPWMVHQGAKVVPLRSFDPQRFLELLQEEKVTGFGSVPALLDYLKFVPDFEKYDWSSVKVILVYAAPVPVTLLKEYEEAGIQVRQLYGLTEGNTGTVLDAENAMAKAGSCDRPFFHTEIRVVDEQGKDVEPDVLGEVLLQNPKVADVAVIGYPHEKWGEAVKAVMVVAQGEELTAEELIEWCQGRIGKFKIPKELVTIDAIPRTPTGKILKRVLRDELN
ncbi:MAG: long-chain fatty acid--CoA ligase [Proteobacteria bacterium]|nr:long-chain fatty acid--CoA ligase [Pseudomonadota bacterium]